MAVKRAQARGGVAEAFELADAISEAQQARMVRVEALRAAEAALSSIEERKGQSFGTRPAASYRSRAPAPSTTPSPAADGTAEAGAGAGAEVDAEVDADADAARAEAEAKERARAAKEAREAERRARMTPEELLADDRARMAREARELKARRKQKARADVQDRKQRELAEKAEEIWGAVDDIIAKVEAEVDLTEEEMAQLDEAWARDQALKNQEAVGAVADLGKSLFGAFLDIGISAVSAAVGSDDNNKLQEGLRAQTRSSEQREKLAMYEAELNVLGLNLDDAAVMSEAQLRTTYRARVRTLHPDLNAGGGAAADEDDANGDGGGDGVPSIYALNEAYETVKRVL